MNKLGSCAVVALALGIALGGCALFRGAPEGRCKIDVVRVESWNAGAGQADAGFHVRGEAGQAGRTWLVAERADGSYVPGDGVDVGPGPFEALVELKLTGRPKRYLALLELDSGKRCRDTAKVPT
jgi:hypothetical protein